LRKTQKPKFSQKNGPRKTQKNSKTQKPKNPGLANPAYNLQTSIFEEFVYLKPDLLGTYVGPT